MSETTMSELIDKVLEQIKKDISNCDMTAIEELIMDLPKDKLEGFLSEE